MLESLLKRSRIPTPEIMRSYLAWEGVSHMSGPQIASTFGDQIRKGLERRPMTQAKLLVCAYNEVDALPRLLYSLRTQNIEIILVDNASTDGTKDIAIELGVKRSNVIYEKSKGLAPSLRLGFEHIHHRTRTSQLFITDADSFVPEGHINRMIAHGTSRLGTHGGIINGPVIFTDAGMLGHIRTGIHYAKNIYYLTHGYANAAGANTFIQFDNQRKIPSDLANHFDPTIKRGTDELIQDLVVNSKGRSLFSWAPIFTSGSRYTSFASMIDAFLRPTSAQAYTEWNGNHTYRSPRRPKIFRY